MPYHVTWAHEHHDGDHEAPTIEHLGELPALLADWGSAERQRVAMICTGASRPPRNAAPMFGTSRQSRPRGVANDTGGGPAALAAAVAIERKLCAIDRLGDIEARRHERRDVGIGEATHARRRPARTGADTRARPDRRSP